MLHKLCRLSLSVNYSELHPNNTISFAVYRDITPVSHMPLLLTSLQRLARQPIRPPCEADTCPSPAIQTL